MTADEFLRELNRAKSCGTGLILIAAHVRPDGDAVSSVSAAGGILHDAGYNVRILLPDPVPDYCVSYIPKDLMVTSAEGLEPSMFLILDCSNAPRIASAGFVPGKDCVVVNIDHHPDDAVEADFSLVQPKACATAQILSELLPACGFAVSPENATRLLLGIITDSGCFRFDNASPEAMERAAGLIRLGADRHRIIVDAYSSRDSALVRLEADLIVNGLHTAFDGRAAWFVLTKALLAKYGVDVRNTENLIDAVRNIQGVEFAALLREESNGWKLSLRTKNAPWSAGRVARRLNGGGHEMAAGGFIPAATAEEAGAILVENIRMELEANEKQS